MQTGLTAAFWIDAQPLGGSCQTDVVGRAPEEAVIRHFISLRMDSPERSNILPRVDIRALPSLVGERVHIGDIETAVRTSRTFIHGDAMISGIRLSGGPWA
jgi:hypothetical protein